MLKGCSAHLGQQQRRRGVQGGQRDPARDEVFDLGFMGDGFNETARDEVSGLDPIHPLRRRSPRRAVVVEDSCGAPRRRQEQPQEASAGNVKWIVTIACGVHLIRDEGPRSDRALMP